MNELLKIANEILTSYLEKQSFELTGLIDKICNNEIENNLALYIGDSIKDIEYLKKYKQIIYASQDRNYMQNKIICDLNNWCFQLNKFDAIFNVLSLHKIFDLEKFFQLLYFALIDGGEVALIFFGNNSFNDLKKTMIDIDMKFENKTANRINNFHDIGKVIHYLSHFKNTVLTSEKVILEYKNIKDFFMNKNNSQFFTKHHMENQELIIDNISGAYEIEIELNIIIANK